MYKIRKNETGLLVKFKGDFDYSTIKRIFNDELIMPDFNSQHDIWLIEHHRAQIRLAEIQSLVEDFSRLCPRDTTNKKLAIVAYPGLTSAILDLLADGLDRKLPFSCRTFCSIRDAEDWVADESYRMA